jgi:hyperosmotically inducible protein
MSITRIGNNMAARTLAALSLAGFILIGGCSSSPKYVDSQAAVNTALQDNSLQDVQTSQDRNKGIMTLTGTVPNQQEKTQAEQVAKTAAPTYTIANQIVVAPPAADQSAIEDANSHADSAIEDEFKAQLKRHPNFKKDDISIESKNMSVTLTGTARTQRDKQQAEKIAKGIPNVTQVINKIEVKGRH